MSAYSQVTVSVTQGRKIVFGSGTSWFTLIPQGSLFSVDGNRWFEIDSIADDAAMYLTSAYPGATAEGLNYSIIQQEQPSNPPNNQTGTTYTLTLADNGVQVRVNNTANITVNLPTMFGSTLVPDGFACSIRQISVGQALFVLGEGATNGSFAGYTKTAGEGAIVLVEYYNPTGVEKTWFIDGTGA